MLAWPQAMLLLKSQTKEKHEGGGVKQSFRIHPWLLHSCKQNKECGLRLRHTLTPRPAEGSRKAESKATHTLTFRSHSKETGKG